MHARSARSTVLTACAAALLAAAAAAQEPPDRQGAVQEEVVVERVVIDAHVIGHDGNPIPDLTPEDFRVKIDGRSVVLEDELIAVSGLAEVHSYHTHVVLRLCAPDVAGLDAVHC